jgi:prepilin-type N-terminal cleavage/methylation domain-containing protein
LVNRLPRSRAPHRSEAGFTLIELMVVVTIISIVCVLAIPSMSHEGYDRRAFTDAASVSEIVREAKTRAVARGAAQLLVMNANSTGNAASFILYESQAFVASGGAAAGADGGAPAGFTASSSSCNYPTVWPGNGGTQTLIDEFQFAGGLEAQGNINMRVNDPTSGLDIGASENLYLCFTPAGRTWYAEGTAPPASFTTPLASLCAPGAAAGSCVGAVTVDTTVGSFAAGSVTGTASTTSLVRTVWIPSSGATRMTSQ